MFFNDLYALGQVTHQIIIKQEAETTLKSYLLVCTLQIQQAQQLMRDKRHLTFLSYLSTASSTLKHLQDNLSKAKAQLEKVNSLRHPNSKSDTKLYAQYENQYQQLVSKTQRLAKQFGLNITIKELNSTSPLRAKL